ncbi:MAG: 1,4-alpha-glucan branching protein GlgB [Lachnospiraceae bacterium]|nr:1,4-alpha-glucan branching protein GlgB [uncultured Acetatifactor sp.]MCI8543567.1 1,4-alpha-glucan branching protein GlgB [Lachnospiraceae bacterium]
MTQKLYNLMNWPKIEEIIYLECDNPHEVLGPHKAGNQTLVQAYFPGAAEVSVVFGESGKSVQMELADEDGFFAALLPEKGKTLPAYHYLVKDKEGGERVCGEAYRAAPQITVNDTDKFNNGIHYTVYEKLGAHPMTIDNVRGVYFAVWAPNVIRASVVGDFNGWDGRIHQMRRLWDSGIFELFVPDAKEGDNYKFELKAKGGLTYLKADPYGNAAQLRPETASVVADLDRFVWEDEKFIKGRAGFQTGNAPVSVYEMYLGSVTAPLSGSYANYREIAARLIPYIKEMGYTHVELMPVMEHPLDGSWGYQVIGYYAPTARYGSPEDFMYFVNELHKAGIGVILDWVPAHFPRDAYGLSNFDGTCLYEHRDPRQGSHPHWGTLIYNYGRPQVSNYLIANALFWVEKYHVDGIRMDAVASMLYLDYGKKDGEWVANMYGGKENLEAIEMIKHLNSVMKKRNPGVLSIAEESTAFPKITGALEEGGLGFDLKWNMGFMNDYLDYIKYDPYFRAHHHGELTFSMVYAYSEKFMLVFSHDEVVHGKASLIGKMPGEREQKFANLRLTYAYMMTHPGKKLLFMGQDLGEFDEWNEARQVEWELAQVPEHQGISELMKDLNHLYRATPELYALDDAPEGFEWVNHISWEECFLTFLRKGRKEDEVLLVVANFSGVEREITTGVPYDGKYKEIFNTDNTRYGGTGIVNSRVKRSRAGEWDDRPVSVTVKVAPLSLSILKYIPLTEEEIAIEAVERAAAEKAEADRLAAEKGEAYRKAAERMEAYRKAAEKTGNKAAEKKTAESTATKRSTGKNTAAKKPARRAKSEEPGEKES